MVADVIFGIIAEESTVLLICLSAPGTGPLAPLPLAAGMLDFVPPRLGAGRPRAEPGAVLLLLAPSISSHLLGGADTSPEPQHWGQGSSSPGPCRGCSGAERGLWGPSPVATLLPSRHDKG